MNERKRENKLYEQAASITIMERQTFIMFICFQEIFITVRVEEVTHAHPHRHMCTYPPAASHNIPLRVFLVVQ